MSQPRPLVDRSLPQRLLKWQLVLAVGLIAGALCLGRGAAISVGLGAGIAIGGSAYFAWQAFRYAGAAEAQQIVRGFYRGEAGKILITAFLFAAVFIAFPRVNVGWLFAGFILEQLLGWLAPLVPRTKQP